MFRREAWKRAGGYKAQYQPAEDAELWTRIVALGFKAKQVIADPWFTYRVHNGSLSAEIRQGRKSEPDWRTDKPWVNDKQFPFAADGKAYPVRNYDKPKVAIIIPVASYHVPYLPQALDSVEKQTERYWECIVVNDTGEDLPGLGPFPWAKVIDTPTANSGAGAARNLGVKHATAPFVTFLDADDMLLSRFLEVTLKKYQQTGRYIYTDWLSLNKEGIIEQHQTPEQVTGDVFQKPVQHAVNILIKRKWFEDAGGFDESMTSWEDVDFFMRLAKIDICGARVPEPLFIYRYMTGQRRENGELIKGQIIASFNQKYGEYIRGEKMCGCVNNNPGKLAAITSPSGGQPAPDQLVRIVYQGAIGQHTVAVGKNQYGYRKGGDTFYVRYADVMANPHLFQPIAEVLTEKQPTPTPPPPPTLTPARAV
jgi:GT2 family glycosyltransferase